jgi:hypothetical protein
MMARASPAIPIALLLHQRFLAALFFEVSMLPLCYGLPPNQSDTDERHSHGIQ